MKDKKTTMITSKDAALTLREHALLSAIESAVGAMALLRDGYLGQELSTLLPSLSVGAARELQQIRELEDALRMILKSHEARRTTC